MNLVPFLKKLISPINAASIVFIGILAIYITFCHVKNAAWEREGKLRFKKMEAITPEMIEKIDVYGDAYGYTSLNVPNVNSINSKLLFAEVMHDLTEYHPNHDRDTQSFFIRMFTTTGEKYEFSVWLKPGITGTAFLHAYYAGNTNCGSPEHSGLPGAKKSSSLYRWLEYHKLIKEADPQSMSA